MTSPTRAAGFTLIEMIVVLVVLGLVLAVVAGAAPRRGGRLEMDGLADAAMQALREARARAIAQEHPVAVAADASAHALRLGAASLALPNFTRLVMAPRVLRFAPDGSASGAVLRLAGPAGTVAIAVDSLTGRVERETLP